MADDTPEQRTNVAVAMLGMRFDYAVSRFFCAVDICSHLFFETCAENKPMLRSIMAALSKRARIRWPTHWTSRYSPSLTSANVTSFELLGFTGGGGRSRARSAAAFFTVFEWTNRRFRQAVIGHALRNASAMRGLNNTSLELFRHAKREGCLSILAQAMLSKAAEATSLAKECARRPTATHLTIFKGIRALFRREIDAQPLAEHLVTGFDLDAKNLVGSEVRSEKITALLYGVYGATDPAPQLQGIGRRLEILLARDSGLCKDVPYLLETPHMLWPDKIESRSAGSVRLAQAYYDQFVNFAKFLRIVPRVRIMVGSMYSCCHRSSKAGRPTHTTFFSLGCSSS